MKDRQPTNAGRVQLVPVVGQTNIYDMTMADGATEQGTPLNKANLLKDATAALYGLPDTAVPNDVFAYLGKYAEHSWGKYIRAVMPNMSLLTNYVIICENVGSGVTRTVYIADEIDENLNLVNPRAVSLTSSLASVQNLSSKAPFYIKQWNSNNVLYVAEGAVGGYYSTQSVTIGYDYYSAGLYSVALCTWQNKAYIVNSTSYDYTFIENVFSTNRNAYPDEGMQSGYYYAYKGVPYDNILSIPKVETGSYVGTGTYGVSNPNGLTFEKQPKLVHIYYGGSTTGTESWYIVADFDPNIVYGTRTHPINENGGTREQKVQWSNGNKTLSWYNTQSAAYQMNAANVKFYYYVIY